MLPTLFLIRRPASAGCSSCSVLWSRDVEREPGIGLLCDRTAGVPAVINSTVGGKVHSRFGIERATGNWQAWSNFVDTYGLGVGLGSARASSFPLVVLSNLGLPGGLMFSAFLWRLVRRRAGAGDRCAYWRGCAQPCFRGRCLTSASLSPALPPPASACFRSDPWASACQKATL